MSNTLDVVATVSVMIFAVAVAFVFGLRYGAMDQCQKIGAEYHDGKCVIVTRTEVKL